jgi:hypothetical protein
LKKPAVVLTDNALHTHYRFLEQRTVGARLELVRPWDDAGVVWEGAVYDLCADSPRAVCHCDLAVIDRKVHVALRLCADRRECNNDCLRWHDLTVIAVPAEVPRLVIHSPTVVGVADSELVPISSYTAQHTIPGMHEDAVQIVPRFLV